MVKGLAKDGNCSEWKGSSRLVGINQFTLREMPCLHPLGLVTAGSLHGKSYVNSMRRLVWESEIYRGEKEYQAKEHSLAVTASMNAPMPFLPLSRTSPANELPRVVNYANLEQ